MTIEDLKHYRLKTEEEMTEDLGKDWRRKITYGYVNPLDSRLGQNITSVFDESSLEIIDHSSGGFRGRFPRTSATWSVSQQMITPKPRTTASSYQNNLISPLDDSLFKDDEDFFTTKTKR